MEDFDIESAVDEVSGGLGIEISAPSDDVELGIKGAAEGTATPAPEDGKTAPEGKKAAAPAATPAPGTPTPAPAPGTTQLKAPASWRPEAKAEFDKLPEVIKAEVAKREEDILRGIGEYRAAANFGTAVDKAIQPYVPVLRQYGIDPIRHVGELFDVHQRLALGSPEVKHATLSALAKQFGVTLAPAAGGADDDNPYVDPEVKALRTQMAQLQSLQQQLVNQQTSQQQAAAQAQRAAVVETLKSELNTFAADPEHAFFDEVADDMAMFIQSGRASSLKQAYDLAIRMNPAVSEKDALRKQSATEAAKQKAREAAAAKTTAARRATGVNVKSQVAGGVSKGPSPGAGLQNLDNSIEAAFDQIMSGGKS